MKPLSETELREKIDDYVDRFRMQWKVEGDEYHQSELIEDIAQLIIQDRKVYSENIKNIIKMSDKYTFADGTVFVRQRNQGEKTDE